MATLVIAEHDNVVLQTATLNTITAAIGIGGEVHILVAGHHCATLARSAAQIAGVTKVLLADASYYADQMPENLAALITPLAAGYSHILAPATSYGKSFLPRVAALLDVAQVSDIVAVVTADTFVQPLYAGSVLATIQSLDAIKVITVRAAAFAAASPGGAAVIETLASGPDVGRSRVVSREIEKSPRPDLAVARVIVAGGRGLASSENYRNLLEPLADKLGAALGASRAAVDAGFAPNDHQIGETGRIIAPQLYIAVGISGALQHLAGVSEAKIIVALNKDPEAPVFQVADYGLVADLFQAVPELTAAL
jgi:electron transfer flavoprotein alpha subunit